MGRTFSIILDATEEVAIMKDLCAKYGAYVANIKADYYEIYFELITDSETAEKIVDEFDSMIRK